MQTNLSAHLSADISILPNFSFQPLPELGIEESVVCFWEDEQVSFILSLDEQTALANHQAHWQLITESITKEFGNIQVTEEGEYQTDQEVTVSFKLFDAGADTAPMIYHLISNGKVAYWVIGSLLFCSDEQAVNQLIIALLETATLR